MAEQDWEDEDPWESFEVQRSGDDVFLVLSRADGSSYLIGFSPEDATEVGIALAQAGQEEST